MGSRIKRAADRGKKGIENLEEVYASKIIRPLIYLALLVVFGSAMNVLGFKAINLVLAAVVTAITLIIGLRPKILLSVMAVGAVGEFTDKDISLSGAFKIYIDALINACIWISFLFLVLATKSFQGDFTLLLSFIIVTSMLIAMSQFWGFGRGINKPLVFAYTLAVALGIFILSLPPTLLPFDPRSLLDEQPFSEDLEDLKTMIRNQANDRIVARLNGIKEKVKRGESLTLEDQKFINELESRNVGEQLAIALTARERIDISCERILQGGVEFFDPLGKPKYWYSRSTNGALEWFDGNGRHPQTREVLMPVTPEIEMEATRLCQSIILQQRNIQAHNKAEAERKAREQRDIQARNKAEAERMAREQRDIQARNKAEAERKAREQQAFAQAEAERKARKQQANAQAERRQRWKEFEDRLMIAPASNDWLRSPNWRAYVSGKRVMIKYNDARFSQALSLGQRLNTLGAVVSHEHNNNESNLSQIIYPFSGLETATTIQSAAVGVVSLELISSGNSSDPIEVVLQ